MEAGELGLDVCVVVVGVMVGCRLGMWPEGWVLCVSI